MAIAKPERFIEELMNWLVEREYITSEQHKSCQSLTIELSSWDSFPTLELTCYPDAILENRRAREREEENSSRPTDDSRRLLWP